MKKLALMAVFAFLTGSSSLALAGTAATAPVIHHPRIHEVHTRMHDQFVRIKAGIKNGKLTQDQAQALKASLKAVQDQMKADFNTNGSRDLTDDQLKQLNQMLNENSKTIYGEKHPDGSTSGSASDSSSTGITSTGSSSTGSSSTGSSATGNTAPSGN